MWINKRLGCLLFAALFCAALLCPAPMLAQQANLKPPTAQPGSATVNGTIKLDVVVTEKSGPPVGGLQQQDFTVLDNKAPQTITSFKPVTGREGPIEVVIVIDAVNTAYTTVAVERTGIDKFLQSEGGHLAYPVALVLFTDKGTQMLGDFSSDGATLSAALAQAEPGLRTSTRSSGFYGAVDRMQLSVRTLGQLVAKEAPRPGRKIILWVSPGWPLLSGPRTQLSAKDQQSIFANIVALSNEMLQARVTLYSINPLGTNESIGRANYYKDFLKGVSKPSQAAIGNLGLPILAIQSGGLALTFNNDISTMLQQCVADAAPYYEISFNPATADQRDEFHLVDVQTARPGLTARTRQIYYAQPAPAK
ncbi:MAG: VWA domain-containing protein [Candidatus Acidiferrales bacterium]